MNTISNNNVAKAIYLFLKDNDLEALPPSGGLASKFDKVIQFLARKRLLQKSKEILLHLDKIINDEKGRVVAKVASKNILNEETKKKLTQYLTKHYFAKEVIFLENLDEKLLGGFRIEVNDEVIDLTIKNKIGKLQEYLIKSI